MKCLPKELINEIRAKMNLVGEKENRERYSVLCYERKIKSIKKAAQINSYRIEHPEEVIPFNLPRKPREVRRGIKHITGAFKWGEENFNPATLDEYFLKELACKITPDLYPGRSCAYYRNIGAKVTGSEFISPSPEKVRILEMPHFIQNIILHLENPDVIEVMKTAFYAHFNLTRIHPFEDGNGRTARTFQNVILNHYGFPVPVIESGERMTYYAFLRGADEGYKERKALERPGVSDGEKQFYVYMAGKVNSSLNNIIDCLH